MTVSHLLSTPVCQVFVGLLNHYILLGYFCGMFNSVISFIEHKKVGIVNIAIF